VPRTTAENVGKIIEVDTDVSLDLEPFITAANELVTECCSDAGYTDARLELIERWLASHFYAIRDPRVSSEAAGVTSSYLGPSIGFNLKGTKEGQQALLLDTAGGLAALSDRLEKGQKKTMVGIKWLGTDPEETE
jgi:hypothetical protein